jgi:hypothetical protein
MEGKRVPQDIWDKIEDIPFDYMYQKHELSHWKNEYDRIPYCYEILGKLVIIDPYLQPHQFDVKAAWLSSDEQLMTIALYHKKYDEPYFALAAWQKSLRFM